MKKPSLAASAPRRPHSEMEIVRLVWLAIFVSVFSFLFYYRNGDVLLYGDAVAHINIARRVFDSKTPGPLQLGTVWLPLPHLLILPFIVSKKLWQSGAGGSIPSMAGFVFGVLGLFRLVRVGFKRGAEKDDRVTIGAWIAALIYAANPNLMYMQATAMGESLYLAFFIWAVAFFAEFARGRDKAVRALTKCGWCVAAACLTRYDGWFLAAVLVGVAILQIPFLAKEARNGAPSSPVLLRENGSEASAVPISKLRSALVKFILLAAAGPVLWLGYNAAVYRNPLEFSNGPYSAKAIERDSATVNPAKGSLPAAGSYFLKVAELNVGATNWFGRAWLALAVIGSVVALWLKRGRVLLLLWTPLPFYALSIAYGGVPIFVPTWWPFSLYNVRYGLQLLPALIVFSIFGIASIVEWAAKIPGVKDSWKRWEGGATLFAILALASASYTAVWRAEPICYREAFVNSRGRIALDSQLAKWVESLPRDSTLLMYLGQHAGILERAGIPLRRDISEGNHRVWKRPDDPDGLWERALADPAKYADYVIGFEGDPVWKAAQAHHLTAVVEIHTLGQPRAAIFLGGKEENR